jgi:hypothetical protein
MAGVELKKGTDTEPQKTVHSNIHVMIHPFWVWAVFRIHLVYFHYGSSSPLIVGCFSSHLYQSPLRWPREVDAQVTTLAKRGQSENSYREINSVNDFFFPIQIKKSRLNRPLSLTEKCVKF